MRHYSVCALAAFLALPIALPQPQPVDRLKEQFRNPPREYSMTPLWAWNSALEKDKLVWQIDQMVDKGVYGAFMHARPGLDDSSTPYFSEGFWNGIQASVEHAAKVGFHAWIYDEDGWPSGSAGGRTYKANPERYRQLRLVEESKAVTGPAKVPVFSPDAESVVAARSTGGSAIDGQSLVDLTPLHSREGATWEAPAGAWRVFVYRVRQGRNPNYLNPEMTKEFLRNTYDEYDKRFSKYFGNTIPGVFSDEPTAGGFTWDPVLAQRFQAAKSYDLRKFLPLLSHEGGKETIKVRCDYFETYARLYADAWLGQLAEWSGRRNLKLTGHTDEELGSIPGQGDYFRTVRNMQIPGTDNEDFRWHFPRAIGSWKPKQLSSLTHMYGQNRAAVEALGGAGWTITLAETRNAVNLLAAYGLNQFIFHLFHYEMDRVVNSQDYPNSWFYQNPYWKYFKKFADYMSRLSFMGSQGQHVADVAILYPVEDVWSYGLGRMPEQPIMGITDRLVREQIDFDIVDTDSILKSAAVDGGRARIGTESYRVIVIPGVRTVSAAAYRRVAELASKGVRVVAFGQAPRNSAERGADDPEVISISERLFGNSAPRDLVKDENALTSWIRAEAPADVQAISGENREALRYLHRRVDNRDAYLLVNSENRALQWDVRFAASGLVERWDPASAAISTVHAAEQSGGRTTLALRFEPWEAYYIVFDRSQNQAPSVAPRAKAQALGAIDLKGPWTIQFAPTELDNVWKADAGETVVRPLVMDVRIARKGSHDEFWRQVKLQDAWNPVKGAARYLSAWDAAWITRFGYEERYGNVGGPDLTFVKEIEVPFDPAGAWLAITADARFEMRLNGEQISSGADVSKPVFLDKLPLKRGRNEIEVRVRGASAAMSASANGGAGATNMAAETQGSGYLLTQGEVRGPGSASVPIRSDRTWRVKAPGKEPVAAFEMAFPPFGKWGDIALRGEKQTYPVEVRYRTALPAGARSVERPVVSGKYSAYVNEKPIAIPAQGAIPIPAGAPSNATFRLRVEVASADGGLQQPLAFHTRPAAAALRDWQETGMGWYSGRAVYRTSFDLPKEYSGSSLTLNLGDMRYTGEVWVNGKLADTVLWPPYRAAIDQLVKPGRNELVVVVANLRANRARWDIFDEAVSATFGRWWSDGNLLREPDHLRSGLLGPVRITASGGRE